MKPNADAIISLLKSMLSIIPLLSEFSSLSIFCPQLEQNTASSSSNSSLQFGQYFLSLLLLVFFVLIFSSIFPPHSGQNLVSSYISSLQWGQTVFISSFSPQFGQNFESASLPQLGHSTILFNLLFIINLITYP